MEGGLTDGSFKQHNLSFEALDERVNVKVIHASGSLFIWVGQEAKLTSLVVSMPIKYATVPASTQLLGNEGDLFQRALAQRIAKRFGQQVFLSYAMDSEPFINEVVEKKLLQLLTELVTTTKQ